MSSDRNPTSPAGTVHNTTKRKPTRRDLRDKADRRDWRTALRDAATLTRVRRAF